MVFVMLWSWSCCWCRGGGCSRAAGGIGHGIRVKGVLVESYTGVGILTYFLPVSEQDRLCRMCGRLSSSTLLVNICHRDRNTLHENAPR